MTDVYLTATDEPVVPIRLVRTGDLDGWLESLTPAARQWVRTRGFEAKPGQSAWLPDADGRPSRVAAGWDGRDSLEALGGLPLTLPEGVYQLESEVSEVTLLGWGAGAYQYQRYRAATREPARLMLPLSASGPRLGNFAEAIRLVRDLVSKEVNG
jgi:leucyl aminopeptidase